MSLNANNQIIKDKLGKLEMNKEILRKPYGREEMEKLLGFKLRLKIDRDFELMHGLLQVPERDKSKSMLAIKPLLAL